MFKATELRRKHWDSLPAPLADLLEACLDPDPQQRPKGFEPVLAVLRECSRVGQEIQRREQEERLLREQEEEQWRQWEGEEELRQLVRATLDRTGGKPTSDDTKVAKDLCRRYKLPADRANMIVREVKGDWCREREEREERSEDARRAQLEAFRQAEQEAVQRQEALELLRRQEQDELATHEEENCIQMPPAPTIDIWTKAIGAAVWGAFGFALVGVLYSCCFTMLIMVIYSIVTGNTSRDTDNPNTTAFVTRTYIGGMFLGALAGAVFGFIRNLPKNLRNRD